MAKNRVKGITIEIGGSTTGLDKALKGINSEISKTQLELKDVDRLLKLDPKNTELLKQKQELLAKAVDQTKEKLNQLKDAEKIAKKQMEDGDLGKEKYEALQREIVETEQKIKSLEKQQMQFNSNAGAKMEEAGEKISAVGGKVQKVGKGLTVGITAPLVAAGGAAAGAFKEVDEAMDTVTKKTGASGKALKDMQDRAKKIAETIPTDFQTAADAVGEVNTRFGLTGEALEELSTQFVEFAELNDTDVSSSIDSVQSAMEAWGIESKDAGQVLDLLNKAGQDTGVSVDELSELLKKNKTALDEAGFSMSDSAMLLANLDKNGVDAGTALRGFKKSLQEAAKDGRSSKDVLDDFQATMEGGSSKADKYKKAIEVFGKQAGPAIADACAEGRMSFDGLGTSMEDFSGNVKNTFDETLDPIDEMQMSMNTLKDLGAEIVESAAPMLKDVMEKIRDVVSVLKDKWDGLSDSQKEMIIKIAGIAAAIGPLMVAGGGILKGVGSIMQVGGRLMTFISGAGGLIPAIGAVAAAAGPFLIGGAIIAGIIAAVILIIKNWDKIKKFMLDLCEKIGSVVTKTFQGMKEVITAVTGAIKKVIETVWKAIKKVIEVIIKGIKIFIKREWDGIKVIVTTVVKAIKTVVSTVFKGIKTAISTVINGIKNIVKAGFNFIKNKIIDPIKYARHVIKELFGKIKEAISSRVDAIKEKISNVFGKVKEIMTKPFTKAKETISNIIGKIKGLFNFKWSLPKPKLPHFKWEWKEVADGLLKLPKFRIEWYKKAMDTAMILKGATVFGEKDGKLLGGGEAGDEVVAGAGTLMDMIRRAVASVMSIQKNATNALQSSLETKNINITYGDVNMEIKGAPGQDVRELAKIVNRDLKNAYDREKAVWA